MLTLLEDREALVGENDEVAMSVEIPAELALEKIGIGAANDAAQSSFTAGSGSSLLAVDADLKILGRWPLDPAARGWRASSPGQRLALISGRAAVVMVGRTVAVRWSYRHVPWPDFESGCTWFDRSGRPYAVDPGPSPGRCLGEDH
jgi:hypothetical protein